MLLKSKDHASEVGVAVLDGDRCFYCHGNLNFPIIQWRGESTMILIHASCTMELILRLARDVHELECLTHQAISRENHQLELFEKEE